MAIILDGAANHYLEEVGFLWCRRNAALGAPNYSRVQFADLDERLDAHLGGLRVAEAEGWEMAEAALANAGPEDFFPATVLAIEAGDKRLDEIVERASTLPQVAPGVIAALGWVDPKQLAGRVRSLIESSSPFQQMLGIATCAVHRRDPGVALTRAVESTAPAVRARALRAAGELGRLDLLPSLLAALSDGKQEARFRSAVSGVLLGDRTHALDTLIGYAINAGPRQMRALQLTLRAADPERGHELLQQLTGPDAVRLRVIGSGLLGQGRYVPWLIEQMKSPVLARVAGEAFVNITGADVNLEQLEVLPPEGFEDGPTDDPADENVEVPEDLALPWLDVGRVTAWWERHRDRFEASGRYLLGQPLTRTACVAVLNDGFQRQRVGAAQHMALLDPGTPLFNTSAPAWRQERWLSQLA